MNIAIVTASIGHGHNAVALALQETLHDDGYHKTQMRPNSAQFCKPFSTRNIVKTIMNDDTLPMEYSL
jgi:UDP-N-acetylglucosamine:LPS N-acetylglucosamine transferase